MAEIILPPEENEETPDLNIDKPTENSKVISIEFEAKKTNKVSTKDTNQQLYTTDTDAWFEFKETSLEGANGTYSVVFKNRHDGSIFQRTGDVVNGVAYYKIPHQEIRHAGAWRGQIVYTLSNGDTTAREFGYDVKGHILDGKDVREVVVEDFETLMAQLRSMKDNAESELANLVNTAEQNETNRQDFFDELVEDINEFEENERQRQANYQELLDTGVLQTNINTKLEQLEEEYAPKLTEVTAQLAQKTDKGNVSVNDINKNLGLFDGTYFSSDFIDKLNDGELNVTSVLDGSLTTKKYADKSVTGSKIADVDLDNTLTVNLFNKNAIESNGFYHRLTGVWEDNNFYASSELIEVKEGERYKENGSGALTFWNNQESYVDYARAKEFEIPEGVRYIRLTTDKDTLNSTMLTLAEDWPNEYVPYAYSVFNNNWKSRQGLKNEYDISITNEKVKNLTTQYDSDIYKRINLFNKNEIETGGYYGRLDGVWQANNSYVSSQLIPIEFGERYRHNGSGVSTFWDSKGLYLSGATNEFRTPEGASYVRLTTNINDLDSTMLTLADDWTGDFIPYEYKISKLTLLDNKITSENTSGVVFSENYTPPTKLDLSDFSGYDQPFHPSVIYIPEGFQGYVYWMVQSPYPTGAQPYMDRWEVPIVYKSNDGINWITVADPLDDLTESEINNRDYMSDPHILYREDTETLEVWYRYTRIDGDNSPTSILRKTTSDGINWSERQEMIEPLLSSSEDFVRSPSIIWDNSQKEYRMWFQNNQGIYYKNSLNGVDWSENEEMLLDVPIRAWHIDVNYYNDQYHLLVYSGNEGVVYYNSWDNKHYIHRRTVLHTKDGNPLYSGGLYRAVSLTDEDGKIRVYFSTVNTEGEKGVALIISDSLYNINGVKKIDGSQIITSGGMSLDDMMNHIQVLKEEVLTHY